VLPQAMNFTALFGPDEPSKCITMFSAYALSCLLTITDVTQGLCTSTIIKLTNSVRLEKY